MKTIGFIGKTTITPQDREALVGIGKLIQLMGHPTVMVKGKGTTEAVQTGIEAESGTPTLIDSGVIENADHTFVYADVRLVGRLRQKYPDILNRKDVTVLQGPDELAEWLAAVEQVYSEKQTN